jgi:transcriptional regulator with XRE-family HTH domain
VNARSLGKTVRWARKRAGLTQHDLAAAAEVPQSTVARIEAGTVLPMTATLMALLKVTGHELDVVPIRPAIPRDRPSERRRRGQTEKDRLQSPVRTVPRLTWFGVPFIVIGDLAEITHGRSGRLGRSIEVCVDSTDLARERLAQALDDLGDRAGRLRVLTETAAGDGYTLLKPNARRMHVRAGITAPVASVRDLIRARRARGTEEDLGIAAELQAILDGT